MLDLSTGKIPHEAEQPTHVLHLMSPCATAQSRSYWAHLLQLLKPTHQKACARQQDFSAVQSRRRVQLLATPWTAARQASLSIQPPHPLSSPSPPALNLSQYQGLFQWVSSSRQVTKVLGLQHQSFQWISGVEHSRCSVHPLNKLILWENDLWVAEVLTYVWTLVVQMLPLPKIQVVSQIQTIIMSNLSLNVSSF